MALEAAAVVLYRVKKVPVGVVALMVILYARSSVSVSSIADVMEGNAAVVLPAVSRVSTAVTVFVVVVSLITVVIVQR